MPSIAEMFRKIRIAPTFDLNRQNWVVSTLYNGWVWNDSINDWQITVGGVTYNGQDLLRVDWYEKQKQWAIENPRKEEILYKRTGIYELRFDPEKNAYYYYDTLGRKIYEDVSDQNALAGLFIGKTINQTPNYNFDEQIVDILGSIIQKKTPKAGLYDTKDYFDLLTKTRKQYKAFWEATNETDKVKALEERATDIVSEEARIINLLAIAQKAKSTDNIVINTVSLATAFFGPVGKAAGITVKTAVRYAQSQTTDERVKLLGEELEYLNTEYEAIKAYFDERNAKLANVTASSGLSNWLVKNWSWIIAAAVSLSAVIYFFRKRKTNK